MLSNSISRQVEWGDCDPAGIVFNPNFFRWFDHSTSMLYHTAGWSKPIMVKRFDIVGCPLVETSANFISPCRYGDDILIESTIREIGKSSFKINHVLTCNERVCVESIEKRVWSKRNPETGKIKSAPLPQEVVDKFTNA